MIYSCSCLDVPLSWHAYANVLLVNGILQCCANDGEHCYKACEITLKEIEHSIQRSLHNMYAVISLGFNI